MNGGTFYKASYKGAIVKGYGNGTSGSDGSGGGGCLCSSLWTILGGYLTPISQVATVKVTNLLVTSSFNITSDATMKANIEEIPSYEIDKLCLLEGKSYNIKTDLSNTRFGYIAQDMERIYPNLVHTNAHIAAQTKAIDYIGLIPLIIEKIKRIEHNMDNLKS